MNESIDKTLKTNPNYDGIFFTTDTLTLMAIKALRYRKINVPEMFKIVSFDENETFDFLDFNIPHFSQPLYKIGKEALHIVVSKLDEKTKNKPKKIFFDSNWFEK